MEGDEVRPELGAVETLGDADGEFGGPVDGSNGSDLKEEHCSN